MRVKIRLATGPPLPRQTDPSRRAALALASLLNPASVMLAVLAGWALAADRGWGGGFAFETPPLSDWRFWLAGALALRLAAFLLARYGRSWHPPKPPIIDLAAEDPIRREPPPPPGGGAGSDVHRSLERGPAIMP